MGFCLFCNSHKRNKKKMKIEKAQRKKEVESDIRKTKKKGPSKKAFTKKELHSKN